MIFLSTAAAQITNTGQLEQNMHTPDITVCTQPSGQPEACHITYNTTVTAHGTTDAEMMTSLSDTTSGAVTERDDATTTGRNTVTGREPKDIFYYKKPL